MISLEKNLSKQKIMSKDETSVPDTGAQNPGSKQTSGISPYIAVMNSTERTLKDAKRFAIQCRHCNTGPTEITKWKFIQNMWYEEPHGCMGGDCWHQKKIEVCHMECPWCNKWNYIYNHPQAGELKKLFSEFSPSRLFKAGIEDYDGKWTKPAF